MQADDEVELRIGAGHRVRASYVDVLKAQAVHAALHGADMKERDEPAEPADIKRPAPQNRQERRREMRRLGMFKGRKHR